MAQTTHAANLAETTSRVSVFVSYAREDNRARQDLCDSLVREGVDVNGDWTLLQGPDYWEQVVQQIRQSDVLLALVSPAVAASDVVRREIDEAVSLGKRILPVVIEDIPDPNLLHLALRQPQWTFLRPDDPRDTNHALLVQAIRTDFADLREHTDLLLAALRWEVSKKDSGLTLRGQSLRKAGNWMDRTRARPSDRFPKVTLLQEDYYRASLAAAKRRKVIGAVAAVALITAGLIAFMMLRSQYEVAQRAEEQRQALADQETSRQEAANALVLVPFKREEAAGHVQKALSLWRTPEAIDAERQLSLLRGALHVNFEVGAVSRLGFLRDGAIVILGHGSSPGAERSPARVFVRCADDSDVDRRYRGAFMLSGTESAGLRSLASSSLGETIVAAGGRKVFAYTFLPPAQGGCNGLNIVNRTPSPQVVLTHTAEVTAVAVNALGTLIAFGDENGTVVIARFPSGNIVNTIRYNYEFPSYRIDASGKQTNTAPAGTKGTVTALVFSEDSTRIAVGTAVGRVAIWPTLAPTFVNGAKPVGGVNTMRAVHAVALHPKLPIIAMAMDDGIFVASTSIAEGLVQQNLNTHSRPIRALLFSPDGRYLVSGSDDQQVMVWDMVGIEDPDLASEHPRDDDRLLVRLMGHTSSVSSLAIAPDGVLFASGGEDGIVVLRSIEPLGAIQADARKTLAELRAKRREEWSKEPPSPPPTAEEIGVMIAIPALDKALAERASEILSRHLVQSVSGIRDDGGTTYTNTFWMPREKAQQILEELKVAGISAEIKTP